MSEDDLALAMDKMQPQWFIEMADGQDLRQFAIAICINPSGHERAVRILRNSVVRRAFNVCRAAVHAGHLTEVTNSK